MVISLETRASYGMLAADEQMKLLARKQRLEDALRAIAGWHDGHDVECPRCVAQVALEEPDHGR